MTEASLARPRPQVDDAEELDRVLRNLVEAFDPIAIFRGRGEAWQDSDYDLMVVLRDDCSPANLNPTALWSLVCSDRIDANVSFSTRSAYAWRRHAVGTLEYEVEMDGVRLHPSTEPVFPAGQPSHLGAANVKIVHEWLDQAQQDIDAAIDCIHGPRTVPTRAAFHVQQAAEKLAKAALVAHRIRPERTHESRDVVAELPDGFPLKERFSDLERFSDYAVALRYPGGAALPIPSAAEVEVWIAEIEALKADFGRWLAERGRPKRGSGAP